MAMTARFFRLSQLHRRVDEAIRSELRKVRPDGWRLLRLKALRLSVKTRLSGQLSRTAREALG